MLKRGIMAENSLGWSSCRKNSHPKDVQKMRSNLIASRLRCSLCMFTSTGGHWFSYGWLSASQSRHHSWFCNCTLLRQGPFRFQTTHRQVEKCWLQTSNFCYLFPCSVSPRCVHYHFDCESGSGFGNCETRPEVAGCKQRIKRSKGSKGYERCWGTSRSQLAGNCRHVIWPSSRNKYLSSVCLSIIILILTLLSFPSPGHKHVHFCFWMDGCSSDVYSLLYHVGVCLWFCTPNNFSTSGIQQQDKTV